MNDAEQFRLTRWGIPGWTAILSAFLFAIVDIAFAPPNSPSPLFSSITSLLQSTSTMSAALAALIAAVAGVPLGFCIYQAYFWLRWNSPVSRDGFLPPLVVGRMDDLNRTVRDLSMREISRGGAWRSVWIHHPLYNMDHGWRWRYIENHFTEVAQRIDSVYGAFSVFGRHRVLLDLMHTLGASLVGIYLGFAVYLLAKVKLQHVPFTADFIVAAASLLVLLILLDREDHAKKQLENNHAYKAKPNDQPSIPLWSGSVFGNRMYISLRVSHPAVIFLILFGAFLYLVTPSPYVGAFPNPTPLRALVLVLLLLGWYFAKRAAPAEIRNTETFLIAVSILAAYFLSSSQLSQQNLDWPYCWSILAFLAANLVFLKNRQNVRDDLIALEYFTLRRALETGEQKKRARPRRARSTAT